MTVLKILFRIGTRSVSKHRVRLRFRTSGRFYSEKRRWRSGEIRTASSKSLHRKDAYV